MTARSCRISVLVGTRPEAIKLSPVVASLVRSGLEPVVVLTGQHADLLLPIVEELRLPVAENLAVMQPEQSLAELSARVLLGVRGSLLRHQPSGLLVQGDTTSAAMGALAGFYEGLPIGHVEAGLRTRNRRNPYPEEMNRRLIAQVADLHFAPTAAARDNLVGEGLDPADVHLVGNTVVDSLMRARDELLPGLRPDPLIEELAATNRRLVLVTGHRRESHGPDLIAICRGLSRLALTFPDVVFVYPVHPNPAGRHTVIEELEGRPNVRLTGPAPYLDFVRLMLGATLIITDSGGVQEEAATLGVPVLVTRRTCERLEAVRAGVSQLVTPEADAVFHAGAELLGDPEALRRRAMATAAFGDGRASERIVSVLRQVWQID